MDFNLNGTLTGNMISSLSDLYIAFLTPSVIGSFSVLVASIVKWRHLGQQVHVLVQLAGADFLAALILISSSIMNKVNTVNSIFICQHSLPLSLTFYFISFLLVVIYAWKSKNAIQGWRQSQSDDQRPCARTNEVVLPLYALVWLIPLALYIVYMFTDFMQPEMIIPRDDKNFPTDNAYCTSCILFLNVWKASCSKHEQYHVIFIRVFLFIVVIPVMLICSVIYYKVGKWYENYERSGLFPVEGDGRSTRRYRNVVSTARNMVLVILICWAPALVLILLSTLMIWASIEQRSLFWLYVIQAIGVSLQGFLNSMVYAWRRRNFTEAVLGEHTPLMTTYNHLPFFDQSI